MRILICTQSEPRDGFIDGKIKQHLEKLGHEVKICNFVFNGRREVIDFKPHVVVMPEARCEYSRDFSEQLRYMKIRTVVRRTESGFTEDDPRSEQHKQFCIGNWPYEVDLELVWSDEFADILRNKYHKDNVVVCGGVVFDVYFPRPPREKQGKKVVLFATIWDYADRRSYYCVPELPVGDPIQRENYRKCRSGRDVWINEIRRVCEKYPDWHVIVKVHPAEHPTEYVQKLGKIAQVINAPKAVEVLPKTDLLVHAGSTMAVEAHLMGIPAIQFCDLEETLISKVSPHVESVELERVDLTKSNANIKVIEELERRIFGRIDGKGCQRIAEEIDKLKPRKVIVPNEWPEIDRLYETPSVFAECDWHKGQLDAAQCIGCKNMVFIRPHITLFKCPHCSLALCRAP